MKTRVITSAIIQRSDKFLIVKRAPDQEFAPSLWEFVIGFLDEGETADDTVLREVQEEIGCKGKILKKLPVYEIEDNEANWVVIPFVIQVDNEASIRLSHEHTDFAWVSRSDLNNYPELAEDVEIMRL